MNTRPMIEQLKSDEASLRRKIEEMKGPLAQAEEDLRNVAGAIAFYERSAAPKALAFANTPSQSASVTAFSPSALRGMTHKQAAIAIAKHNGGIIHAQSAKHLMIQAGIMRETKNSTRMVHNAIIGSERFDRIAPGTFRLRVPTLPSGTPTAAIAAGLFHPKPIQ
jgi:hypothetical protein